MFLEMRLFANYFVVYRVVVRSVFVPAAICLSTSYLIIRLCMFIACFLATVCAAYLISAGNS
jgi:hypothetical protein